MNIYKAIENEKTGFEKSITQIEKELEKLPEGTLRVQRKGQSFIWIRVSDNDKKRTYIKKKDFKLAEALARKGLLKAKLRDEKNKLKAAKLYLKYAGDNNAVAKYACRNPEYARLSRASSKMNVEAYDETVQEWVNDIHRGVIKNPKHLIFQSEAGYKVRSKSEVIIISHLLRHNLPFKYEQELFINGHAIHPDFMVMNPRTHKIYIWEHYGRMDDIGYINRNIYKIEDYASIGHFMNDNLILTFETLKSGIDEKLIEYYIDLYLK